MRRRGNVRFTPIHPRAYLRGAGTVSRPGNSSNATDPVAVLTMVRERHQTEEVRGNQRKVVDRIVSERTEQNPFYMIYGCACATRGARWPAPTLSVQPCA